MAIRITPIINKIGQVCKNLSTAAEILDDQYQHLMEIRQQLETYKGQRNTSSRQPKKEGEQK